MSEGQCLWHAACQAVTILFWWWVNWKINWKYFNWLFLLIEIRIAHDLTRQLYMYIVYFKETLNLDSCFWGLCPDKPIVSLITLWFCIKVIQGWQIEKQHFSFLFILKQTIDFKLLCSLDIFHFKVR